MRTSDQWSLREGSCRGWSECSWRPPCLSEHDLIQKPVATFWDHAEVVDSVKQLLKHDRARRAPARSDRRSG